MKTKINANQFSLDTEIYIIDTEIPDKFPSAESIEKIETDDNDEIKVTLTNDDVILFGKYHFAKDSVRYRYTSDEEEYLTRAIFSQEKRVSEKEDDLSRAKSALEDLKDKIKKLNSPLS